MSSRTLDQERCPPEPSPASRDGLPLLWQEILKGPVVKLGAAKGFGSNLEAIAASSFGRKKFTSRALCPGSYIGGASPFSPTVTRGAVRLPSASRRAVMNTCAPGCSALRSAGAKVTIGTPAGMLTFFSPSL